MIRGAAFATHRLLRVNFTSKSSTTSYRSGIQPPKADEVSTWLYFDVVRQEPQIEHLKKSPAKNIQEQIDRARLAMWLNDAKQAQAVLEPVYNKLLSTSDWLEVACFISCDLQGQGKVSNSFFKERKMRVLLWMMNICEPHFIAGV